MVTHILVNIGSGNGLLPDSTNPLTNIDLSSVRSNDNHMRAISHETPQQSVTEFRLKISYLKFHSDLPGTKS